MIVLCARSLTDLEKRELAEELKSRGYFVHFVDFDEGKTAVVSERSFPVPEVFPLSLVERVVDLETSFQLAHRNFRPQGTVVRVGNVEIGGETVVVIAGPCAVESREQLFRTAEAIQKSGGHILRGGAFKPRTSPYSFQGLGIEGLEILAEAREYFGLPVVTEATSPENAELVAAYADMIQVGARNMQNFELLKKVGMLRKPVLLKRGMSATVEDFLLAAEYILSLGNFQVVLCERGIRTIERLTRNTLDLTAIPLIKELSHLPIIVDPSHGTGLREKVIPMARAALACGADGIMVEVHPDPERALSDGPQSLRIEQFRKLMRDLEVISILVGRELKKRDIFVDELHGSSCSIPSNSVRFRVAFLGEQGSFSSQVARRSFGEHAELLPCQNFREIFERVSRGEATHGVLPIENTITGSIHHNFDLLLEFSEMFIVGERFIRVSLHLGLYPGTRREELQVLFAHPQGFAQCGRFLERLRDVRIMNVGNTEEAARRAAEFGQGGGCISSEEAIAKYGLERAEEDVEDNPRNFTRFIIISRCFEPLPEHDKVSCVFALRNYPGALYEALGVFARRGVNLLKLESRPFVGRPWEYLFYVDWEGNLVEEKYRELVAELKTKSTFLRVLGSYRNAWKLEGFEVGS
ncbi:MAG: 3-deoxy-7-phosphoheptulonate synthase [Candidatus Caldatribacterium sp.]|uniref:3-deoxy-7-phosphoheptulonate synthase n=1 Tax=Candidatus Caldatribacterium sp. TaxID=2282143 RepID=UPI0029913B3E|nr:3-deoxy-7-phosphoheptulonate synthase [Candidatus Caldatribacterium sp.]MCX7730674.1 3-deoxy-7-phosphoheptulonate synthase [Candidatus Caldatribacterium sp.]MDW8080807.1 3-deoxy-7-phosphoheptulonate synthase [Candidatus Calescibacterium sp.]